MKLTFSTTLFCLIFSFLSVAQEKEKTLPPSSNKFNYGHCLTELSFSGSVYSNYIPIAKDDGTGIFGAPHFTKTYLPDCLADDGQISKQIPVAFVSGTKAKVQVKFKTDCKHSYYIRGLGSNISTGQIIFPKQQVSPTNGYTTYGFNVANIPFVAGKVKYWEQFIINWQISETGDDESWIDIAQSTNEVYITHKAKVSTLNYIYHTVLDVACKAANNEDNPNDIVAKAFIPFSNLQVKRASDDYTLTYYGINPPLFCGTVAQLLATGDGWCGAWAYFFDDIIKSQGITGSSIKVITPSGFINSLGVVPVDSSTLTILLNQVDSSFANATFSTIEEFDKFTFLVKNWSGINQGNFILLNGATNIDEARSHAGLPGIPGQGNIQDPRSIFANHGVVSYDGKIYDPSYGASYPNLQMEVYEDASIDAVRGVIIKIHFNNNSYKYYYWVEKDNLPNIPELQIY